MNNFLPIELTHSLLHLLKLHCLVLDVVPDNLHHVNLILVAIVVDKLALLVRILLLLDSRRSDCASCLGAPLLRRHQRDVLRVLRQLLVHFNVL